MFRSMVIAAALVLALGAPASAQVMAVRSAPGVDVGVAASAFAAHNGGVGATVNNSAIVLVQVNQQGSGTPVANLGASVGNGTAPIMLPPTITLFSNGPVPPGGCLLQPTEFYNWGNGSYNIRVVPLTTNPSCHWLTGTYTFVVHIHAGNAIVGSGVGSFAVP